MSSALMEAKAVRDRAADEARDKVATDLAQERQALEVQNVKAMEESLRKQRDDACVECERELELQTSHISEEKQSLVVKCESLGKELKTVRGSVEEARSHAAESDRTQYADVERVGSYRMS